MQAVVHQRKGQKNQFLTGKMISDFYESDFHRAFNSSKISEVEAFRISKEIFAAKQ
jgi:hypothetical protein